MTSHEAPLIPEITQPGRGPEVTIDDVYKAWKSWDDKERIGLAFYLSGYSPRAFLAYAESVVRQRGQIARETL